MKTIIIDDVFEFDKIGEGAEGEVFKIDDDTVYKYLKHRKTREDKIKKIKYLKNIDLEKFVQIKDIVSDGYVEIGYTMKLVKTNSFINVKKALNDEISLNEKIEYIKDIENRILARIPFLANYRGPLCTVPPLLESCDELLQILWENIS